MSLSTLDRRIASGRGSGARREPRGRRHRVYVMLDDEPPENGEAHGTGELALAVARGRIRGLEEQVAVLQGQLDQERQTNAGLVDELAAAQVRRGPWWRFW